MSSGLDQHHCEQDVNDEFITMPEESRRQQDAGIHQQKDRSQPDISAVLFSSLSGRDHHQHKSEGNKGRRRDIDRRLFFEVRKGVEAHHQQHTHVNECEPVGKPVLRMEPVPDEIEHVHRETKQQEPCQEQFP